MTAIEFAALLHAKRIQRDHWIAHCPAHRDRHPSLAIREGRKQPIVFKCMSQGCTQDEVLKAMGLTWKDLMGERPAMTPELRSRLRDERDLREWKEIFSLLNACAIWGGISLRESHIARIDYEVRRNIRRLEYRLERSTESDCKRGRPR